MSAAPRAEALPEIAVYAPMKPPDDPVPSGDREIARLTLAALARAGFAPRLASRLRLREGAGDAAAQARLLAAAEAEADALAARLAARPPALWLTYHCYYKAPDLLGPRIAERFRIPYAITEPSISPKRREGSWAAFAAASEDAIARADRLFWTTERDRPALEAAGHGGRMVALPPFLDPGPRPAPRPAGRPLRLITVAMMRPGDKAESYRRLAAGLARLALDWRLEVVGAGPAEAEVRAGFAPLSGRVRVHGAVTDRTRLRALLEAADVFVWPGVGEGVGMAWLEAQAAGLPAVAEEGPAAGTSVAGPRARADDPEDLARAIAEAAADRERLGRAARAAIEARHSIDAAAATLARELGALLA